MSSLKLDHNEGVQIRHDDMFLNISTEYNTIHVVLCTTKYPTYLSQYKDNGSKYIHQFEDLEAANCFFKDNPEFNIITRL
jgi:hypothetical protein